MPTVERRCYILIILSDTKHNRQECVFKRNPSRFPTRFRPAHECSHRHVYKHTRRHVSVCDNNKKTRDNDHTRLNDSHSHTLVAIVFRYNFTIVFVSLILKDFTWSDTSRTAHCLVTCSQHTTHLTLYLTLCGLTGQPCGAEGLVD